MSAQMEAEILRDRVQLETGCRAGLFLNEDGDYELRWAFNPGPEMNRYVISATFTKGMIDAYLFDRETSVILMERVFTSTEEAAFAIGMWINGYREEAAAYYRGMFDD